MLSAVNKQVIKYLKSIPNYIHNKSCIVIRGNYLIKKLNMLFGGNKNTRRSKYHRLVSFVVEADDHVNKRLLICYGINYQT